MIILGPTAGIDKDDDDEACEIGSDESDEDNDDDEVNKTQNSKAGESKLHDSIRSSRTATFKSIKFTPANQTNPTGESYYAFSSLSNLINNNNKTGP